MSELIMAHGCMPFHLCFLEFIMLMKVSMWKKLRVSIGYKFPRIAFNVLLNKVIEISGNEG